jgi:hypothetical protein
MLLVIVAKGVASKMSRVLMLLAGTPTGFQLLPLFQIPLTAPVQVWAASCPPMVSARKDANPNAARGLGLQMRMERSLSCRRLLDWQQNAECARQL